MQNTVTRTTDKKNSQVHTTMDYFMFRPIDGNRTLNLLHLNRLKKSITQNYLFTVITVNENYEIIDGQHRFEVVKELKLPLNYIICEGYGLKEVHILNQISKTWNADDYLTGYCDLGYKDYLQYREFKEEYGIGHYECMTILSGSSGNASHVFYDGTFRVKNLEESKKAVQKILLVAPYYEGFKRRSFILTMIGLFKNPKFEYTEFLHKLKLQPTAMVNCSDNSQYVSLVEHIYNYRRREKINLRY